MHKQFEYQSKLAPYIRDFIYLKESSGCNFLRGKWILYEIDRFFHENQVQEPVITRELVHQWRQTRINDTAATLYSKYSVFSQLARYMCRQGCNCFIPRLPDLRHSKSDFSPYIFTHDQINQILQSSDRLRMYDRNMSNALFCIPVVLRLI